MTRRRHIYLWIALAVVLLALGFLFDGPVHGWVTAHSTPGGLAIARQLSKWGDWPGHVLVGALGLGVSLLLRQRSWTLTFTAMLLACALAGIVSPVIKNLTGRSRPYATTQIRWNGPSFEPKKRSFPSGHTLTTTAFFAALLIAQRRIGLVLLPIPIAIALSRIYLSAHYLSDVIFGATLGIGCALVAWQVVRKRMAPAPA